MLKKIKDMTSEEMQIALLNFETSKGNLKEDRILSKHKDKITQKAKDLYSEKVKDFDVVIKKDIIE